MDTQNTTVPVGPSEYAAFIALISTLLIAFFGHDWGLGNAAPAIATAGAALISVGTSIARAVKHHALHASNAVVYAAQLAAAYNTAANPGTQPTNVTSAMDAIQGTAATGSEGDAAP